MKLVGIRCVGVLGLVCVAAIAHKCSAAMTDFESPLYLSGTSVVGQDGWVTNAYVGPGQFLEINGDALVSDASPLSGGQSLLYTQTINPSANGGGLDISKASVVTVKKDGTPAIDAMASFLIQVDKSSVRNGQVGLFFSFNAFNGWSPIGVLLNNANSETGSGRIEPLDAGGFNIGAAQPYVANDVLEFQFGIDFDSQDYELAYRNLTTSGGLVSMIGSGTSGRFKFNGAFPDDGDGMSYTIDVGALLRGGVGKIDDISVVAAVPEPSSAMLFAVTGALALVRRRRFRRSGGTEPLERRAEM